MTPYELAQYQLMQSQRMHGGPYAAPGHPVVGWTTPVIIYDRMKAIDASATELDKFVTQYAKRAAFVEAWKAWLVRWKRIFDKYQTISAQLGAVFYTDELASEVEGYRRELNQLYATYAAERDAEGNPLPSPVTPPPGAPPEAPKTSQKEEDTRGFWARLFPEVPWWGVVLGVGAVGFVGYQLYKMTQEARKADHAIRSEVLPRLIPGLGTSHDPDAKLSEKMPLLLRGHE